MKKVICLDLRCLQIGHESRGIGMHVRSILENIDPRQDYEYIFYAYEKNDPIKALGINIPVPYTLIQTRTLKKSIDRPRDFIHLARIIFHRFSALKDQKIDVFIQFDFMLGIPHMKNIRKSILIAYDLIPLIFSEDYIPTPFFAFKHTPGILPKFKKTLRALYYQGRYHLHYKNFIKADKLLSISKSTAQSLGEILHIPLDKVAILPLAPVFNTTKQTAPEGLRTTKPFIFYIGATDARKRVSDLIKAFDKVRKSIDIDLVLAGKEFSKPHKIPSDSILTALSKSPFRGSIHTLGYVDDAEKIWLYRHAEAFVFPTAYEGFGLPIIEAFMYKCPVISYDNSSIPEVAGKAALLVPTGNINELANAIINIHTDQDHTKEMKAQGYQQAKAYTWKKYMDQLYEVFEELS